MLKWTTNDKELQNKIDENELYLGCEKILKTETKVLGVKWDTESDELVFSFHSMLLLIGEDDLITKRFILKIISSVFDPLGVLSPFVMTLKLFFQELCSRKCSWDEELDEAFKLRWKKTLETLKNFENIRISRYYLKGVETDVASIELHGFADASRKAYACVIYLRIVTKGDDVCTRFVASKTRVAPLAEKRIPRLELLSCLILSRLVKVVMESLTNLHVGKICCWTDSMDCAFWINRTDKLRKKFVQN